MEKNEHLYCFAYAYNRMTEIQILEEFEQKTIDESDDEVKRIKDREGNRRNSQQL